MKVGYNVEILDGTFKNQIGRVCISFKHLEFIGVEVKGYNNGTDCLNTTVFGTHSGLFIPIEWLKLTNKPLTDFNK